MFAKTKNEINMQDIQLITKLMPEDLYSGFGIWF